MNIEKFILAVITTKPNMVTGSASVFTCATKEEMEFIAANLEAILDGIAHALGDDLYVIVKH
ncbi:hypothetical protein PY093_05715 [Cytobacillus sp. S13-E01]|uniref:capping complex subunit for YIEGIA n=1 Tax=Cytobacillus sp. S13-E01 TaxID=3031326 RepID=UPI0023D8671E|nr:hypothetical protein [Cytobacillus sp. S13-E01]MDF0726210.1 hypothetical protein [Cytobacillus sp. S13-E01]